MKAASWIVVACLGLASCSTKLPPDQVMLSVCREFVLLKPLVAEQISLDALKPVDEQRFDYKDLLAIRTANQELDGFCPLPLGYSPLPVTLTAAQSALRVLAAYRSNQVTGAQP